MLNIQLAFLLAAANKVPDDFPVIVTSYEIVIADAKFLQSKYRFKYIVVDEGHRLKNFNCRLIRELKQIPSDNRLLLSGKCWVGMDPRLCADLHGPSFL